MVNRAKKRKKKKKTIKINSWIKIHEYVFYGIHY